MKKIILSALFIISFMKFSYAEIGVNVGVSGQMGLFAATGNEVESSEITGNDTEVAGIGYGSVFIEKTLGDRFSFGIDYVPSALSTDTVESVRGVPAAAPVTNTLQIDFKDLTTFYVALNVTENMYLKAGMTTVDVITNESLETGSSYGNTDLDGTLLGVGYNRDFDNTMFVRVEGNYMNFDGTSLTSTTNANNVVTLKNLDGVTGKISIGKSF